MAGINAAKWLATHPVASRTANTPTKTDCVAVEPSRAPGVTSVDSGWPARLGDASDRTTESLPSSARTKLQDDLGRKVIPRLGDPATHLAQGQLRGQFLAQHGLQRADRRAVVRTSSGCCRRTRRRGRGAQPSSRHPRSRAMGRAPETQSTWSTGVSNGNSARTVAGSGTACPNAQRPVLPSGNP